LIAGWINWRIANIGAKIKRREEKIAVKKDFDKELENLRDRRPLEVMCRDMQRLETQRYLFSDRDIHTKFGEILSTIEAPTDADTCKATVGNKLTEIIKMMEVEINKMFD